MSVEQSFITYREFGKIIQAELDRRLRAYLGVDQEVIDRERRCRRIFRKIRADVSRETK